MITININVKLNNIKKLKREVRMARKKSVKNTRGRNYDTRGRDKPEPRKIAAKKEEEEHKKTQRRR